MFLIVVQTLFWVASGGRHRGRGATLNSASTGSRSLMLLLVFLTVRHKSGDSPSGEAQLAAVEAASARQVLHGAFTSIP